MWALRASGGVAVTWFRIDDGFGDHPKVIRAGNAAVGLWVRCGAWSSKHLTDGHIPPEIYAAYGRTAEIERLVSARLWQVDDSGMWMPDYLDYNPSRADVMDRRKADRERKRQGRGDP